MLMGSSRRIQAGKTVRDIEGGDFVRRKGYRGVGFVEEVLPDGFAWVSWPNGRKDLLPRVMLRRVRAGGHDLDSRRWRP
jgi:hypothetical protein